MRCLFFSLVMLGTACSIVGGNESGGEMDVNHLQQHWLRSIEEEPENASYHIFRPADFKEFPPLLYRREYIIKPGGECEWLYLAPNDAHYLKSGGWRLETGDDPVLHIQMDDRTVSYRIVELRANILRMIRLEDL